MVENKLAHDIQEASDAIRLYIKDYPVEIGLVLGSGLNKLAESIEDAVQIDFAAVPHMKSSTANGHVGRFVVGKLGGKHVCVMQGRLHGYEGNTPEEVAFPIRVMHALGATVLITTNAAGAINESYQIGDFCIMKDQINFTGRNPIVGVEPDQIATRFVSMLNAFDPDLRTIAKRVANQENISVQEGVYLGLLGPTFETPAEIKMFRSWGADTVAMSVVEEVIAARHLGMRVLGISLVSNMACGIDDSNPSDEEVIEEGAKRNEAFGQLITGILKEM